MRSPIPGDICARRFLRDSTRSSISSSAASQSCLTSLEPLEELESEVDPSSTCAILVFSHFASHKKIRVSTCLEGTLQGGLGRSVSMSVWCLGRCVVLLCAKGRAFLLPICACCQGSGLYRTLPRSRAFFVLLGLQDHRSLLPQTLPLLNWFRKCTKLSLANQ